MPCKSFMIADLLSEDFESKSSLCPSRYLFLRTRGTGVELDNDNHFAWLWHWLQPNSEDRFSPSSELVIFSRHFIDPSLFLEEKAAAEVPIPPYVRGDKNNSVLNCPPKRRNRTVFTDVQLKALERMFEKQRYLSSEARTQLAISLGLTQLQVKTWYQNRRMKWKKEHQQRKQNRSVHPKTPSCSA